MSKRRRHLFNPRLGETTIFIRHACEIIRCYRDDPLYMPSKGDLKRFNRIKQVLETAAHFAAEIHQRMEGRYEGRESQDNEN